MGYEAKSYDALLGTPGFSDALLRNHFALYQGYVKNTNALVEALAGGAPGTPEHAELQRRLGWEFNGMRMHELYFDNMSNGGVGSVPAEVAPLLDGFRAVGAMRGIGWAVLYFDRESRLLMNVWVNEHDAGHLAGCAPILVMDVFEHAYLTDYGLKRGDYIEAFMRSVNWGVVASRLAAAAS